MPGFARRSGASHERGRSAGGRGLLRADPGARAPRVPRSRAALELAGPRRELPGLPTRAARVRGLRPPAEPSEVAAIRSRRRLRALADWVEQRGSPGPSRSERSRSRITPLPRPSNIVEFPAWTSGAPGRSAMGVVRDLAGATPSGTRRASRPPPRDPRRLGPGDRRRSAPRPSSAWERRDHPHASSKRPRRARTPPRRQVDRPRARSETETAELPSSARECSSLPPATLGSLDICASHATPTPEARDPPRRSPPERSRAPRPWASTTPRRPPRPVTPLPDHPQSARDRRRRLFRVSPSEAPRAPLCARTAPSPSPGARAPDPCGRAARGRYL